MAPLYLQWSHFIFVNPLFLAGQLSNIRKNQYSIKYNAVYPVSLHLLSRIS